LKSEIVLGDVPIYNVSSVGEGYTTSFAASKHNRTN